MQLGRFAFFMPVHESPVARHCRQKDASAPKNAEQFRSRMENCFDQRQQALSKDQNGAKNRHPAQQ
jgi:hypothetical protein